MVEKQEKVEVKVAAKKSDADMIWEEIVELPIQVFALPGQTVGKFLTRLNNPNSLFVRASATAILPALEEALGKKYSVEITENCWIIRRS